MTIYDAIQRLKGEIFRLGEGDERDLTEEEESLFANAITALEMIEPEATPCQS